jgi:hypothetical protein
MNGKEIEVEMIAEMTVGEGARKEERNIEIMSVMKIMIMMMMIRRVRRKKLIKRKELEWTHLENHLNILG